MTGTALLIKKDRSVRILENIKHGTYEELVKQENANDAECMIDEKMVHFGAISKVIWCENSIDWNYGY